MKVLDCSEISLSADSSVGSVAKNSRQENKLCLDLCSGKGGFSQAFVQAGWKVVTVDIETKFNPTVVADITKIAWEQFKRDYLYDESPGVLLASPPCTRFTVACPKWPMKGIQKGLEIIGACFEAVVHLEPKKWLIENPRGRLRWILGNPKQTVRYSDYDLKYPTQKFTDFWGNIPLPMVNKVRTPHIGHLNNGWWRNGHGEIPKSSADRAFIPLGVSQAVLRGVEGSV